MKKHNPETWLVAAGRPHEPGSSMNTPLIAASNYVPGGKYEYSRNEGSPTWEALEAIVGGLEGGDALAFSSGMAAAAAVFDQLGAGSLVALPDDCYQGVAALAEAGCEKGIWTIRKIAVEDTGGWIEAVSEADIVWLESPSNPLLRVADLKAICAAPRKTGGILAVDNTFATPLNQQPLKLGADVSMHSATKYIGGHSDLLAGILVSRDPLLLKRFTNSRKLGGATPGALEAFLAARGVRTLALRLERSQENAGRLACWLEQQVMVETVHYPGLESHPNHDLARSQLGGFGSVISFEVAGGADGADALCDAVKLVRHATSLGGVESTMERRAAQGGQEHLPSSLIRLSVGIESADDLIADLEQAFTTLVGTAAELS